jgi:hypothetical protein
MGTNKMAEGFAATLPSFATHFGRAVATDARNHPYKYLFAAAEVGMIFTPLPEAFVLANPGVEEVKAITDLATAAGHAVYDSLSK